MKKHFFTSFLILLMLCSFAIAAVVTVSGQALPTTANYPTTNSTGGGRLNYSFTASQIVIANTDTADHALLLEDGQDTPFVLFNNVTIKAGTTWFISGPIYFTKGLKWASNSTLVTGTIVGQ